MEITFDTVLQHLLHIQLDEYDEGAKELFYSYQKQLQDIKSIEAIVEVPVIQALLQKYTTEIEQICDKLVTVRNLSLLERENLLDKQALYKDFIKTFDMKERYSELLKAIEASF